MSDTPQHFIAEIIADDLASKKHDSILTRFPPEPNGYLHIGHAKSICLNFGIAQQYGGQTNLRFDDTNPEKEDQEYIDAIREDVQWLGFEPAGEFYASDYFDQLYAWAQDLIRRDLAYVDELNAEQMREYRGTLTEPGKPSPWRDRPADESLALFEGMKAGQFEEGRYILRAKIDMAHGNINMRDPALYRIRRAHHPRTGDTWNIYPTYDFAHGQSDAIEGITHSLCTLEFEDHRPLYDWFVQTLPVPAQPRQIEFSRLQLENTLTSKRKLLALVTEGHVSVGTTQECRRSVVCADAVTHRPQFGIFARGLVSLKSPTRSRCRCWKPVCATIWTTPHAVVSRCRIPSRWWSPTGLKVRC